jgi:hypothetical protein
MRRLLLSLTLCLAAAGLAPSPAYAQQSFNFYLGGFVPRGEDARSDDDVLVANLDFLSFDIGDFNSAAIGGEWLVALSDRVEAGVGLGIHSRSVPSVYTALTHADGREIEQDLKLRVVPITATIRFLPLGRTSAIQPYVGAGLGIFAWRYSEVGEFVDPFTFEIFRDRFVDSGATAGPVILGGLAFPIGPWSIGGEIRYQSGQGELDDDLGFAGSEIDLGGFNYLATFKIRF